MYLFYLMGSVSGSGIETDVLECLLFQFVNINIVNCKISSLIYYLNKYKKNIVINDPLRVVVLGI